MAETLAVGQAAAAVALSVRAQAAPAVGQAQIQVNGPGGSDGQDGAEDLRSVLGPLASEHCGKCHTRGGALSDPDALAAVDMDQALSAGQRLACITAMLLSEKTLTLDDGRTKNRMPKDADLAPEVLGTLIREFSSP